MSKKNEKRLNNEKLRMGIDRTTSSAHVECTGEMSQSVAAAVGAAIGAGLLGAIAYSLIRFFGNSGGE